VRNHRSIVARVLALLAGAMAWAGVALAEPTDAGASAALKAKYEELGAKLEHNAFGRPIYLVSSEGPGSLKGDVYALVDYPFAKVSAALSQPSSWCDVMILPFNTKHCFASKGNGGTVLAVRVGRKASQPAEDAYPLDFKYDVAARAPDYLRVVLKAASGPIGTRDYQIALEAAPLDEARTFIHLGYSYGFGVMSRLAMQAYLSTAGRDKVGFTVVGRDAQNRPTYVGGMLGATERNTMRYFLAVEAFLGSLSAPPEAQVQKRIQDWFAATEKYARQLHEMDRGEYVAMKQKEAQRLRAQL
jgi:hypothetical protein